MSYFNLLPSIFNHNMFCGSLLCKVCCEEIQLNTECDAELRASAHLQSLAENLTWTQKRFQILRFKRFVPTGELPSQTERQKQLCRSVILHVWQQRVRHLQQVQRAAGGPGRHGTGQVVPVGGPHSSRHLDQRHVLHSEVTRHAQESDHLITDQVTVHTKRHESQNIGALKPSSGEWVLTWRT